MDDSLWGRHEGKKSIRIRKGWQEEEKTKNEKERKRENED